MQNYWIGLSLFRKSFDASIVRSRPGGSRHRTVELASEGRPGQARPLLSIASFASSVRPKNPFIRSKEGTASAAQAKGKALGQLRAVESKCNAAEEMLDAQPVIAPV
jgi:hypothetical protein